ncbi:MAG TPA: M23 family metallopeptidase [Allosphingosinicella sp.]|jgi:murein DD-endopeptidase MepM/ murein hydrolase activator NlpD
MGKLKLILSNLVTAIVVAVVTSAFWIAAYGDEDGRRKTEPAAETAEKRAAAGEAAGDVDIGPSGLAVPVAGIRASDLLDTYTQARAGGSRSHDAIDIMADHGTPVVAAAPGTVEKLFFSKGGGGITVYVRSPDQRHVFYYAHLQDYAPGLKEGQAIRQGQPIGRVGVTGNSNPDGPHLHFAIHRMAPGEDWHEGRAVNPYPLLAGKRPAR